MIWKNQCLPCASLPRWIVRAQCFALFVLAHALYQGHSQPAVVIGQNFTAATLRIDSTAVPPDADGSAGPIHFVEFINGRVSVFDKSSGTRVKTMTDLAFWTQAGVTISNGWDVTDPRIVFDAGSGRWFASQVDFDTTGTVNNNRFLLGVSLTSDPTGSWSAIAIPSDPGGSDFADFPTIGLDNDAVYLSGDMFDLNSNPVGPTLVSVPKASLLTNPATTNGMNWYGILRYDVRGEVLQPAICFDGSGQGTVLSTGSIGIDASGNFVTNSSLVTFQVKNPIGPPKPSLSGSTVLTVSPYTVPFNPTQPDGSANLDDGDARLSANVYEVGGVLYAVHGTQIGNFAAIRWYRIDANKQTVLESGVISDGAMDLYYPSIAANAAGTVVIAFNGSSIDTFASAFAVVGSTESGVTTFGQPLLLKAGTAAYQNTDFNGISRWGDYSATSVDPADPSRFWTIQEIASGSSTWSIQVTELLTGNPTLSLSTSAGNLMLSWPSPAYHLLTTPDLVNPTWSPVTVNLSTNNGSVTAQLPMTDAQAFFRLQAP